MTSGFKGEDFLENTIWLPWLPEFFNGIKFCCEQFLKRTSQGKLSQEFMFDPLPHGKNLDLSELKAFADDSFIVAHNGMIFF